MSYVDDEEFKIGDVDEIDEFIDDDMGGIPLDEGLPIEEEDDMDGLADLNGSEY